MSCNTSAGLLIYYYIKIAMNIIFIVTPIILLIMSTIDLLGAVTGDKDAFQKAWANIFKRMIIAIIILILPVLINLTLSIVDMPSFGDCLDKATKENIERLEKEEDEKKALALKQLQEEQKTRLSAIAEAAKKRAEEEEAKRREEEEAETPTPTETPTETPTIPIGYSASIENVLGLNLYKQCDSRWGNIVYDVGGGPNGTGATLCSSSCGYTSFAMVAAGLNNDPKINPYEVVKSMRNLKDGQITYRGYGAASTAELTGSSFISKFNLQAEEVGRSGIEAALKANKPLVILVPGHYMALSKSKNGKIVLLDPFDNWASRAKVSGEYDSIADIERAYEGTIRWAAAYKKI